MDKNENQCSWGEALKITLIVLGYIIGFWLIVVTIGNTILHWEQIKTFFGYGGQIL